MRRAVLLATLLLSAGCFGKDDEPADPLATAAPAANDSASNATLPDGRGESLGNKETNRTEAGVGGVEHRHDYWAGREQVVVLQQDVAFAPFPFFPDGQGTPPKGVAYLTLPEGMLVYEGAEKVTLVVKPAPVRGVAPSPAPPALTVQYRTAADAEWREPAALPYEQPFEVQVEPQETDMPHSTVSLWNFRLVADRPSTSAERVNVTVTAYRGRDVADWPGHPDFYAETSERVVLDRAVTTHVYGFPENTFYEGMDAYEVPDKLISYGTGVVDVYVNVTRFTATLPVSPTEYILYVHNATDLGIVCCPEGYQDVNGKNDLASYHFQVPVDVPGMDSPYQPHSRWGFYLAARVGAPVPVAHGFTDGASYDVEYHMTIIARKAETAGAPLPP